MRVRYREPALSDLDQIFRYLDARSPNGARHVIDAIHAAIEDIAAHPLSARRSSDPGASFTAREQRNSPPSRVRRKFAPTAAARARVTACLMAAGLPMEVSDVWVLRLRQL
jgi:plasmid stabilization system protein ParE